MSVDIRRILSALTQVVGNDTPDATLLAASLDFDLSQTQITTTKSVMAIREARVKLDDFGADIFWGISPRREICMLIPNSSLPYRDVEGEIFGANQKIVPSKYSAGFGVVFERDGWACGFTADSLEANIDFIFCRMPVPIRVPPRSEVGASDGVSHHNGSVIIMSNLEMEIYAGGPELTLAHGQTNNNISLERNF